MGLYEVPLSISLVCFGMGTMLPNFHMCGIILLLRAVFCLFVVTVEEMTCVECVSVTGGHSGDRCDLCKYNVRKGDLYVLSW